MRKLTLFFLTTSFVVMMSRCTFTEDIEKLTSLATDSLSLVLGTPVFDTGLQLAIKNAKTNDYIEDAEVTVTVTGKDAGIVYNNLGIKSSAYKTKLGIIHLILDPTKIDSAAMLTAPKEFDMQISAPGYTSVTQRIQFDRKRTRILTVNLIKLNDAPAGVVVASSPGFVNSSASGSSTNIGSLALNGGEQQLKLEPGVVMRDASGAAVTGTVTANVVYYDPSVNNAAAVFPGGLTATVNSGGSGKNKVSLAPIGLFNVKLSAGGKNVKTFSNGGLTLKTEIPEGTINPSTKQPVKENDKINMLSRDEGSGEWTFEKEATVKRVNGKLILEESVTHLSDHLYSFYEEYCWMSVKFNFTGKAAARNYNEDFFYHGLDHVYIYLVNNDGHEMAVDHAFISFNEDGTIAYPAYGFFYRYRNYTKVKIVPATGNYRNITFTPNVFDLPTTCGDINVTVNVSEPSATSSKLDINFDLAVSSGPLTVKPNLEIKYRKTGSGSAYSTTTLSNGKGKMGIDLNTDFDIVVTLGANQGKGKMKIEADGTDRYKVTLAALSLGDQSSSTPIVIYAQKAADGSINVAYKVEVDAAVLNQLK